jgi:hypothetical protein
MILKLSRRQKVIHILERAMPKGIKEDLQISEENNFQTGILYSAQIEVH